MRHIKQVEQVTFSCDQCGYLIGRANIDEDVLPIVLRIEDMMYHFHPPEEGADMFDHTKSCIARWFLGQYHLNKIQWEEGTEPQKMFIRPQRAYSGPITDA